MPEVATTAKESQFRDYKKASDSILNFYKTQHTLQTVEFNLKARQKWKPGSHVICASDSMLRPFVKDGVLRTTMWEALVLLDKMIDDSDPDTSNSQLNHGFQTAEEMKARGEPRWLQCVGLIHDAGKMLNFLDGVPGQWCVVGDTFPVGARFDESNVYGHFSFQENSDFSHPVYSQKHGMYEPNCGLDNLMLSYGHDEYLYHVLKNSQTTLPQEALHIIRYHSFYPWHKEGAYQHLLNPATDDWILKCVKSFNPYDLYTKSAKPVERDQVEGYYKELVNEFLPGEILW